ncbi:flagellar protein FliS [Coprothermobacter proteolyticus DSM 5265]|uniref:Flagellar protein FliS n=1 Tax=Coprothermobacter proteolyticus (strain ATCC 35245 / DSM 5265 / OCM 4 / BT) TaxID=309798 RepID=B5Y7C6_COPPD|nr:flagellar export chaperone FliS [Coprothermobacter proteolyticus]ACI17096.1 flagellar protein FliS [Coprothermobacter proteolyticus DSM 5265]
MANAYGKARQRFVEQEIMNAPVQKLVLMVYDLIITSLQKGDIFKARSAIKELIDGLDFENGGEVAKNLMSLYEYAYRLIGENQIEEASKVFEELREAWVQAFFPNGY